MALGLAAPLVDAARGSPSWLALANPIQATSLFASIVFLLVSGPRLRELLLFLAGAVGFALGHRAWLRLFSFRGVPFEQSALVAAGLASLVAIAARAAASERGSEQRAWFHLAVMLPAFGMAMGLALDLTVPLHGWAWDPIVLGLDAGFGQPSFVVGRLAAGRPALLTLLSLVYLFLPVMMAAMLVLEKRRAIANPREKRGRLAEERFLLAAAVGYALYHVYPVVGPGLSSSARASPAGSPVWQGPGSVSSTSAPSRMRATACRRCTSPGRCSSTAACASCWAAPARAAGAFLVGVDDLRHAGDGPTLFPSIWWWQFRLPR